MMTKFPLTNFQKLWPTHTDPYLQWVIHPVFHASLLTLYIKAPKHRENFSKPPLDLMGGEEQYKVKTIRSHCHHRRKKQLQYLIN
jgi:hypothetical protein